jgi:hypothetical protein
LSRIRIRQCAHPKNRGNTDSDVSRSSASETVNRP